MAGLDKRCGIITVAWEDANDDATLGTEFAVSARATEMEYFGGKLIDTWWTDTSKAD